MVLRVRLACFSGFVSSARHVLKRSLELRLEVGGR